MCGCADHAIVERQSKAVHIRYVGIDYVRCGDEAICLTQFPKQAVRVGRYIGARAYGEELSRS